MGAQPDSYEVAQPEVLSLPAQLAIEIGRENALRCGSQAFEQDILQSEKGLTESFADSIQEDSVELAHAEVLSLAEQLATEIERENALCCESQEFEQGILESEEGLTESFADSIQEDSVELAHAEVLSLAEQLAIEIERENALRCGSQAFVQDILQSEKGLTESFADSTQEDIGELAHAEGELLIEGFIADLPETQSVESSQALRFFTPFRSEIEIEKYSYSSEISSVKF
ncbi:hypothetical protein [Legionella tunisiensis]|uniref:hypothetical protein n=1 Tax=Legionella tunisiensis TaxID=1034944 RepID=UPI0003630054|nr:hypothetical protein [Legionella tunisiensis]